VESWGCEASDINMRMRMRAFSSVLQLWSQRARSNFSEVEERVIIRSNRAKEMVRREVGNLSEGKLSEGNLKKHL